MSARTAKPSSPRLTAAESVARLEPPAKKVAIVFDTVAAAQTR